MSLMTREDMLRELELLPVWQVRVPLPAPQLPILLEAEAISATLAVPEKQPIKTEQNIEMLANPQVSAPEITEIIALEMLPITFTVILNDSADYLFVLPNAPLQADEQRLLKNIFMAMRIKTKPAESASNLAELVGNLQPKLLITLGEPTAQALLQSSESLANLRGKLHQFETIALVATHDLAYLLQESLAKAEAWDDLCLAMQTLPQHN